MTWMASRMCCMYYGWYRLGWHSLHLWMWIVSFMYWFILRFDIVEMLQHGPSHIVWGNTATHSFHHLNNPSTNHIQERNKLLPTWCMNWSHFMIAWKSHLHWLQFTRWTTDLHVEDRVRQTVSIMKYWRTLQICADRSKNHYTGQTVSRGIKSTA